MKKIILIALIVLIPVSGGLLAGEPERVGVYDSRAIAIAWAGTEPFITEMNDLRNRHKAAKEAGDTELAGQLEARGQAMQHKLHQQGFSTAPVDEILARFEAEIAASMEQAGVTVIISRWDEGQLARFPDAEQVDVTMELVKAMKPNEGQLKAAGQIGEHAPVPLEALEKHDH